MIATTFQQQISSSTIKATLVSDACLENSALQETENPYERTLNQTQPPNPIMKQTPTIHKTKYCA